MAHEFRREYLVRLPLPMAQLYCRAHNAKDGRARHDNCFYLFEALVKMAGCPLVAAYVDELKKGGEHVAALDRLLVQLSLPSLGQWVGILRETARYFGEREDAETHPVGGIWKQLNQKRKDLTGALELFRRIKNGPEGEPAGDKACTIMQLIDSLVQYRNAVFGHGASRSASFYEEEMGPLMFPAVNDLLADGVLDLLGRSGSRLVLLTEVKSNGNGKANLELRELIGLQSERAAPISVDKEFAANMAGERLALLWPGQPNPMLLDPLLAYNESEITEDVLFLNRDRNGKQVEYLSYTTGSTQRDEAMAPTMAAFLSLVSAQLVTEKRLEKLQDKTAVEAGMSARGKQAMETQELGDFEILSELGRGGMGVVYLARQRSLGRIVALKMLPSQLSGEETALLRFRREMRALGHIEHPNVIKVITSGTMPGGELYYAMEYVPGTDLEQAWQESTKIAGDTKTADLTGGTWSGAVLKASHKLREQTIERPVTSLSDTQTKTEGASPTSAGSKTVTAGAKPVAGTDESRDATASGPPNAGTSPPDQPDSYNAMRETMEKLNLSLPALPEEAPDDQQRGGYVRRIAAIIRDAALALQTVHDQGFVHRDVKPANLMLTPDGQRVVLMDFGLAKGEGEMSEASKSAGFVGTLRYAAPEQLSAAKENVGPAADVRGLGVTMWELLTRRKLFADADDEMQLSQMVLERDVPLLRSLDGSFDRDIEAIVARATERRAANRIESARDLANYLDLYLQDKPIPIRTPGLGEMLVRWIREHKALVNTAAAAGAALVLTVIVAFVLINNARIKERAAKLQEQKAKVQEQKAKTLATLSLKAAQQSVDEWLIDVASVMQSYPDLNGTRSRLLDKAVETYADFSKRDSDDLELKIEFGKSFIRLGDVCSLQEDFDKSESAFRSAAVVFEKLASVAPDNHRIPLELANSLNGLGGVLGETDRTAEAEATFEAGINVLEHLPADYRQDHKVRDAKARNLNNHARMLSRLGQYAKAEKLLREALTEFQWFASDQGEFRYQLRLHQARLKVGDILLQQGKNEDALSMIQEAISGFEKMLENDPGHPQLVQGLLGSQTCLANAVRDLSDDAAITVYQQVIPGYEKLVAEHPQKLEFLEGQAIARLNLSQTLHRLGRNTEAELIAFDAAKDYQDLSEYDPYVFGYQEKKAIGLDLLAQIYCDLGKNADAYFEAAIAGFEELLALDPLPRYRERLAVAHSGLGRLLHRDGKIEQADASYDRALAEFQQLTLDVPQDLYYRDALAAVYERKANLLRDAGDEQAAREAFQKALALRETLTDSPLHLNNLAQLLAACKDPTIFDSSRAVQLATEATQLVPDNARYWNMLGAAYYRDGKWEPSIASLEKAAQLSKHDDCFNSFYLALAYWRADRREEARRSYERAVAAMQVNQPGNFELIQLREEAAQLLGLAENSTTN